MEHRLILGWSLAFLAAAWNPATQAGSIAFTGVVANDFSSADPNVHVTGIDADPLDQIFQLPEMTQQGLINGWAIKDIRTSYDAKTDTLSVGVNTYSIAGSAIGDGGPDIANLLAQSGGSDPAHLGGRKSITIAFAADSPNNVALPGPISFVAGVPADKTTAGPGIDGFNVATYKGIMGGIQNNYGATLGNNLGVLAFDPDKTHPGFEFTIKNFSTIPGFGSGHAFWMEAYAGSPDDRGIGEQQSGFFRISDAAPLNLPEPATLVAWGLVAGGIAWRRLGRRPRSRHSGRGSAQGRGPLPANDV